MLASKGWRCRIGGLLFLGAGMACGRAAQETAQPKVPAPVPVPKKSPASEPSPDPKPEPLPAPLPEEAPKQGSEPAPLRWELRSGIAQTAAPNCPKRNQPSVGVLTSQARPDSRHPLSLLVASLDDEAAPELWLRNAQGTVLPLKGRVRSGIPAIAQVDAGTLPKGHYELVVKQGGRVVSCSRVRVRGALRSKQKRERMNRDHMWRPRKSWTPAMEALYAAWIVLLFDAETDKDLAWTAMHEVTRDRERNWLWNRKGWGEDNQDGLSLKPDCADTPYFLRAYFAWKLDLPFMFHRCNRGTATQAPRCRSNQTAQEPPIYRKQWLSDAKAWPAYKKSIKDALKAGEPYPKFEGKLKVTDRRDVLEYFFSRTLGWGVHTGNGRVAWKDAKNDFYPVALTRENLRPGTIYADPYGHILMLVDLHAGAAGTPGVLFAVDGQPDASITRKRFWQGNFLWNADPALGGSGFKAFRPLVFDKKSKGFRMLSDKEISARPGYAKRSGDLTRFSKVTFYDHMERLITPGVVRPKKALRQLVDALAEAVRIRVRSVQNGVDWARDNPGKTIEMPSGYKLFETTGAWENFSTPARDLRLLIAIDAVTGFPSKVGRNPSQYGVKKGQEKATVQSLEQALAQMLQESGYLVVYKNSAGEDVSLSLAQVVKRVRAYEMAYNPNDCPEIRWGAAPSSSEAKLCKRRAPQAQMVEMERYRPWFSERRRPARGEQSPR